MKSLCFKNMYKRRKFPRHFKMRKRSVKPKMSNSLYPKPRQKRKKEPKLNISK